MLLNILPKHLLTNYGKVKSRNHSVSYVFLHGIYEILLMCVLNPKTLSNGFDKKKNRTIIFEYSWKCIMIYILTQIWFGECN